MSLSAAPSPPPAAAAAAAAPLASSAIHRKDFDVDGFDPKRWLNAQLQQQQQQQAQAGSLASSSLLSTLTMKLQLMLADVEAALQSSSAELFSGLPKALRELQWLSRETRLLRHSLQSLLHDVYSLDKQHMAQVQFLSGIDAVKQRLESIQRQLTEAEAWRRRQEQLAAVAQSSDLHRIAAELRALQSSMQSLSSLPAHYLSHQQRQVAVLSARLQELCEPAMRAALQAKELPQLLRLSAVYELMAKRDDMSRVYLSTRAQQLDALVSRYDALAAASPLPLGADDAPPAWLSAFYTECLTFVSEECGFTLQLCSEDQQPAALLLTALLQASQRLAAAVRGWLLLLLPGGPQSDSASSSSSPFAPPLAGLLRLFAQSLHFTTAVMRTVRAQQREQQEPQLATSAAQTAQAELDAIIHWLLSPYSAYQSELGAMLRRLLLSSLDTLSFASDSYSAGSSAVTALVPVVLSRCEEAVSCCLALTGGIAAPGLQSAVSEWLEELLSRLSSLMLRLRKAAEAERRRGREAELGSGGEDNWTDIAGLFSLLSALRSLEKDALHRVEAMMAAHLLPAAVRLLTAVERYELQAETAEDGLQEAGGEAADEAERERLFSSLLRHSDSQSRRRALEDFVERFQPDGLLAVRRAAAATAGTATTAAASAAQTAVALVTALPPFNPAVDGMEAVASAASRPLLLSAPLSLFGRLVTSAHQQLFELLFAPLQSRLSSFTQWRQWRSGAAAASSLGLVATELREDGSESELALPSFSLQPSEYSIGMGEYLLSVVQQLEPLISSEQQLQQHNTHTTAYLELDAAYWLQRLSSSLCSLLCRCVVSLPQLSPATCRQLAADLDYLCNVLSAMGIAPEAALLQLMDALQLSDQQLAARKQEMDAAAAGAQQQQQQQQQQSAAQQVMERRLAAAAIAHSLPLSSSAQTAARSEEQRGLT